MADFVAACAKIKALNKADTFCYAEGGTGAWNVLPWIWSEGGSITDPTFTKATGYLNSKGTVAAVTMLRDMLKDGTLSPSILGGGLQTSEAIGKNQVGMIVDGPWMPPIFKEQFPDLKYDLAPIPSGDGGSSSVVGGEDIVMFDKSQNKDAALAFMKFVLEEPQQIAMGKSGQMPVLKSLTGNKDLPDYFAVFQKQLETANPRTPSPAWPNPMKIICARVAWTSPSGFTPSLVTNSKRCACLRWTMRSCCPPTTPWPDWSGFRGRISPGGAWR